MIDKEKLLEILKSNLPEGKNFISPIQEAARIGIITSFIDIIKSGQLDIVNNENKKNEEERKETIEIEVEEESYDS